MNRRLSQFLQAQNMTQTQLADTLGVARGSVSNILSGRNRPGYDFLESLLLHYPALNLEWLMTGRGRMFRDSSDVAPGPGSLFWETETSPLPEQAPAPEPVTEPTPVKEQHPARTVEAENHPRSVRRVVVFYDDNTFQEFE